MGSLLNRYRSLTFLLLVLAAQLVLVAYQVKTNDQVRLLRVWATSAVTPLARLLGSASGGVSGFLRQYVLLVGVQADNRRLAAEVDRLKMENRFLRSELATADRAQALSLFQHRTLSRTMAARVIGTGPGVDSRVILLDRGSSSGVRQGMAVINADGVVGKVTAAYPAASQVLLVTDPNFAAGVISGAHRVEGTLKGLTRTTCMVDYLQNEEKVDVGEWFYTSGQDRLFPRGLPVGQVKSVAAGRTFKQVIVAPSGLARSLEEVLVVLEGVHEPLPEPQPDAAGPSLLPPPPADPSQAGASEPAGSSVVPATDADRLIEKHRAAAQAQGRYYGDNRPAPAPPQEAARPGQAAGPAPLKPPAAKPQSSKPAAASAAVKP
jgi:rod shape-determining protein MreC